MINIQYIGKSRAPPAVLYVSSPPIPDSENACFTVDLSLLPPMKKVDSVASHTIIVAAELMKK
jgi:hypothetical protein